MSTLAAWLGSLFDTTDFNPRWFCGQWTPLHGWVHIVSDFLIWGAYAAIPCLLAYFALRRRDLPFVRLFLLFSLFITSCGTTHLVEATLFWHPMYRFSALMKVVTALVSWATVVAMIPILPRALALPGLERVNSDLEREIAERKRAEEALRRVQRELERRVEERTAALRRSNEELERSNMELQQFAYVASHDLQEPLRMVASYLQLLERRHGASLDEEGRQYVDFAVDGARRMQELIRALLAYSRIDQRSRPFTATDLNQVLQTALTDLQPSIQDAGASVTAEKLPVVMGDSSQLLQLFENLLGNAIKFHGEQPPRVRITAELEGESWRLCFEDNGIGIEREYHERVFDIFTRLQRRDRYPGTGIGLAICRRVAERHGGRIWVESAPGEGSRFWVVLPTLETFG
ncbi:MAG: two-component sensor histidine kinase [Armatimonadetes bacterium]|nr:two-component sensor histidine kinase [Armatimonadota bacterium]